jgi:hypothetical protein
VSKHFTTEIAKCRNTKLQHGVSGIATWSFGVSRIATWSVKISHHKNCRNREMSKGTVVSLKDSKGKTSKSRQSFD